MNHISQYGLIIIILSSCSGYTKEEGKVYLRSSNEARISVNYIEVKNADYESFEVIDHNLNIDLAKDNSYVFKGTSILIDADPQTFEQIEDYFWKDKNHVFLLQFGGIDCKVDSADSKTFKVINNYLWAKDERNVYYGFDKLDNVDPMEFTAIDKDWGRDKTNYFYHNLKLENLNYETAEIVSSYYIKDNNSVFYQNKVVEDANPETFVADGVGSFGHDKKNMFSQDKNSGPITNQYRKTYMDVK